MKQKPELSLSKDTLDLESLVEFFRKLRGRDPSPEEIDEARKELELTKDSKQ